MTQLPPDIAKLEQMYVGGESNNDLSGQAIVVAMRIRTERAFAQTRADMGKMISLLEEIQMFKGVLDRIAGRDDRRDVLEVYHDFIKKQGIVL